MSETQMIESTDTSAVKKPGLRAQFKKAMPVTYFVTKWGGITTAGVSGVTGIVTTLAMAGAGAGIMSAVGGLMMGGVVALGLGLQVLLPAMVMFAAGESLIRYGINSNSKQEKPAEPQIKKPVAKPQIA